MNIKFGKYGEIKRRYQGIEEIGNGPQLIIPV
jgi:hypothetical protein